MLHSPPKIPSKSLHLHGATQVPLYQNPSMCGGNQRRFPLPGVSVPPANTSASGEEAATPPLPHNDQRHTPHAPGWESRLG